MREINVTLKIIINDDGTLEVGISQLPVNLNIDIEKAKINKECKTIIPTHDVEIRKNKVYLSNKTIQNTFLAIGDPVEIGLTRSDNAVALFIRKSKQASLITLKDNYITIKGDVLKSIGTLGDKYEYAHTSFDDNGETYSVFEPIGIPVEIID